MPRQSAQIVGSAFCIPSLPCPRLGSLEALSVPISRCVLSCLGWVFGSGADPKTQPKQDKTQREMGTLKASSEPNRGHGNEGMQKAEPTICADCRGMDGNHTPECFYNKPKDE